MRSWLFRRCIAVVDAQVALQVARSNECFVALRAIYADRWRQHWHDNLI